MIILTLKSNISNSKFGQKPTAVTSGPGLETQWVRNLTQWGLWQPREQRPHRLPASTVAWRDSSLPGQIAQCLRRGQQSGWLCAMCQFPGVGNLLPPPFKPCCPPLRGPYDGLSGQVQLLDCWFWPLASTIIFFPIFLIPDYFKCLFQNNYMIFFVCASLSCTLFSFSITDRLVGALWPSRFCGFKFSSDPPKGCVLYEPAPVPGHLDFRCIYFLMMKDKSRKPIFFVATQIC